MKTKTKMTMEQFEIKITGIGTQVEICQALSGVISSIKKAKTSELDGAEFEDATFFTEVNAK